MGLPTGGDTSLFAKSIVAKKKKKTPKETAENETGKWKKNWKNGEITTCKLNNKTHYRFFPKEETPEV